MVDWVKKKLDIDISTSTVATSLKAVGIELEKRQDYVRGVATHYKVLTQALLGLYKKLGETPPGALVEMGQKYEKELEPELKGNATNPPPPDAKPIPLWSTRK